VFGFNLCCIRSFSKWCVHTRARAHNILASTTHIGTYYCIKNTMLCDNSTTVYRGTSKFNTIDGTFISHAIQSYYTSYILINVYVCKRYIACKSIALVVLKYGNIIHEDVQCAH